MNWIAELNRLWRPTGHRVVTMSDEWKLARRGRLTASSRARSIAGVRAVHNFPKLRDKILDELKPGYKWTEQQFAATEWGNRWERPALSNLEFHLGLDDVASYEPGFLLHPDRPYVGATPDLLIREAVPGWDDRDPYVCRPIARELRTAVQVKCPYDQSVHSQTFHTRKIADKCYWYQLQWEGWVTNADKLVFCSYDPRQKRPDRQLAVLDIPVDHEMRKTFERRCDEFLAFMEGRATTSRPVGLDSLAAQF